MELPDLGFEELPKSCDFDAYLKDTTNVLAANIPDPKTGLLPLHKVALLGKRDVLKILLNDYKFPTNARNSKSGLTALHYSALSPNSSVFIVRTLLENRANPFLPDHLGRTPAHICVAMDKPDILFALLAENRDLLFRRDCRGNTPIHYIFAYDSINVLKRVVDSVISREILNAFRPGFRRFFYHHSAASDPFEEVRAASENPRARLMHRSFSVAKVVAEQNAGDWPPILDFLLREPGKNFEGKFPIHCASRPRTTKVLEYVLSQEFLDKMNRAYSVDPPDLHTFREQIIHEHLTADDESLLQLAIKAGNLPLVSFISNAVETYDRDKEHLIRAEGGVWVPTILYLYENPDQSILRVLQKHGMESPFNSRITSGSLEEYLTTVLMPLKPLKNLQNYFSRVVDTKGRTPLAFAIESKHFSTALYIIENLKVEIYPFKETILEYRRNRNNAEAYTQILLAMLAQYVKTTPEPVPLFPGFSGFLKHLLSVPDLFSVFEEFMEKLKPGVEGYREALNASIIFSSKKVLDYVMSNAPDVYELLTSFPENPIFYSIRNNRIEYTRLLLKRLDDDDKIFSVCNEHGINLTIQAVKGGVKFLRLLESFDGLALNVECSGIYPLDRAVELSNLDVMQELFRMGERVNHPHTIRVAVAKDNLGILQQVLDKASEEITSKVSPAHIAAACGSLSILAHFLINSPSQPFLDAETGDTLLHTAVKSRNLKSVEYICQNVPSKELLKMCRVRNSDGRSVLDIISGLGDIELARTVLAAVQFTPADLEVFTHLKIAATAPNSKEICTLYISHGFVSPVHKMLRTMHNKGIEYEVERTLKKWFVHGKPLGRVFLDIVDDAGYTPIHYAVLINHVRILKLILMDVSAEDVNINVLSDAKAGEMTPLQLAASKGASFDIIKMLLTYGASAYYRNERNGFAYAIIEKYIEERKSDSSRERDRDSSEFSKARRVFDEEKHHFTDLEDLQRSRRLLRSEFKRWKAHYEIYETERNYNELLGLVIDKIIRPMRSSPQIPNSLVSGMFGNFTELYDLSSALLRDLEPVFETWTYTSSVSGVMMKHEHLLDAYKEYSKQYEKSSKVLRYYETLESRRGWEAMSFFIDFMDRMRAKVKEFGTKTNETLFFEPVQRVTRYQLLLRAAYESTPEAHPDYRRIRRTSEVYFTRAQEVNYELKLDENMRQLESINTKIVASTAELNPWDLGLPERRLIKADTYDVAFLGREAGESDVTEGTKTREYLDALGRRVSVLCKYEKPLVVLLDKYLLVFVETEVKKVYRGGVITRRRALSTKEARAARGVRRRRVENVFEEYVRQIKVSEESRFDVGYTLVLAYPLNALFFDMPAAPPVKNVLEIKTPAGILFLENSKISVAKEWRAQFPRAIMDYVRGSMLQPDSADSSLKNYLIYTTTVSQKPVKNWKRRRVRRLALPSTAKDVFEQVISADGWLPESGVSTETVLEDGSVGVFESRRSAGDGVEYRRDVVLSVGFVELL